MATLRTTLPDLYLARLAFLEDVLFDELPIEAGVFQRILKVRDMGNKPFVKTTTVRTSLRGSIRPTRPIRTSLRSALPRKPWTTSRKRLCRTRPARSAAA